jgi:putative transposase
MADAGVAGCRPAWSCRWCRGSRSSCAGGWRTFAWLGRFRGLSKDDEYLTATSEAVIYLAVIQLLVRRLASK